MSRLPVEVVRCREEAARARRLAALLSNEDDRDRALQYAVELDETADRLEAEAASAGMS